MALSLRGDQAEDQVGDEVGDQVGGQLGKKLDDRPGSQNGGRGALDNELAVPALPVDVATAALWGLIAVGVGLGGLGTVVALSNLGS